jgi:hypothetical protein
VHFIIATVNPPSSAQFVSRKGRYDFYEVSVCETPPRPGSPFILTLVLSKNLLRRMRYLLKNLCALCVKQMAGHRGAKVGGGDAEYP